MKKLLSLLLALVMVLGMSSVALATEDNWMIGILTGTVTQGEEELRAAERELANYPGHILTDTYPDSFMAEMETTVSKLLAFADEPNMKAIIACQAVPGVKSAFDKIRELRGDDILLIAGVPQEAPLAISAAADIVLYADEAAQGDTIMEKCSEWGVDILIHYSFPRHMAMETIVARHNALVANSEAYGIELIDVTAPDPTAEAGPSASQQFILEDVPQQLKKYEGKKVAFFTTNCGMQPSLQTAVLDQPNAYYPLPCCPSPYHGFPATLGLELTLGGNDDEALHEIALKLAEHDAVSRFSTWPKPLNMSLIEVGSEYARQWIAGEITERNDTAALSALFENSIPGARFANYIDAEGTEIENFYVITLPQVDFNEYL